MWQLCAAAALAVANAAANPLTVYLANGLTALIVRITGYGGFFKWQPSSVVACITPVSRSVTHFLFFAFAASASAVEKRFIRI